jgi:hypothetical protein
MNVHVYSHHASLLEAVQTLDNAVQVLIFDMQSMDLAQLHHATDKQFQNLLESNNNPSKSAWQSFKG